MPKFKLNLFLLVVLIWGVSGNPFNRGKSDIEPLLSSIEDGWVLRNPYMGMMLIALENQKMWEIPEVSYGNVAYEYGLDSIEELSKILDNLYKEPNFFYTSTIYTSQINGTGLNQEMAKLKTRIHQLRYPVSDYRSIEEMNAKVAEQTYGKIKGFIPKVDFDIPIFAQSSPGVYLNTFFYRNTWKFNWTDLGLSNFTNDRGVVEKVKFIEMTGQFDYFEFGDMTAYGINIPLKGEKKFIRLTKYQNLKTNPVSLYPGMKFRVAVPQLRLNSYGYLNYQKFGVTFCNIGQGIASNNQAMHFMQPIVQEHKLVLSPNVFLFATASGNQITNAQKYTTELIQTGRFPTSFNDSEEYDGGGAAHISPSGQIVVVPAPPLTPLTSASETRLLPLERRPEMPEKVETLEPQNGEKPSKRGGRSNPTNRRVPTEGGESIYLGGGQGIMNNGQLSKSQLLLDIHLLENARSASKSKRRRKKEKAFNFRLDKPFTIALYDPEHGEVAIGDVASVLGFNSKNQQVEDDEAPVFPSSGKDAKLVEKYELWSCGT